MVVANDKETMDSWLAAIRGVKSKHLEKTTVQKKQMRSKKGMFIMSAPLFIPDEWSDSCMVDGCGSKFTFMNRRHHCYYCGLLVCGRCSTQTLPDRTNENTFVRVCDEC